MVEVRNSSVAARRRQRNSLNRGERGKRRSSVYRKIRAGHIVNNVMTVTAWWSAIANNTDKV